MYNYIGTHYQDTVLTLNEGKIVDPEGSPDNWESICTQFFILPGVGPVLRFIIRGDLPKGTEKSG